MKNYRLAVLLSVLALTGSAAAQFTLVSGTIVDPNGTPYALGTISAQVVTAGVTPTVNGGSFAMSVGPANLDTTGSFTMNLVSSTAMAPNLNWVFSVCSARGTIQPAGGVGPVCFTSSISITGANQSISATLSAAAPAISNSSSGSLSISGGCIGANGTAINTVSALWPFSLGTGTFAAAVGCANASNETSWWVAPRTCTLKNLRATATGSGTNNPNDVVQVFIATVLGLQGTVVLSCTFPPNGGNPTVCSDTIDTAVITGGVGGVWIGDKSSGTTQGATQVNATVQCQ